MSTFSFPNFLSLILYWKPLNQLVFILLHVHCSCPSSNWLWHAESNVLCLILTSLVFSTHGIFYYYLCETLSLSCFQESNSLACHSFILAAPLPYPFYHSVFLMSLTQEERKVLGLLHPHAVPWWIYLILK